MKTTLTAVTPVGDFTRNTHTAYTHIVVWASPRAAESAAKGGSSFGVHGRWAKDCGYGVTWHRSEALARKAAAKYYGWDLAAKLIGVFAVK